MDTISKIVLLIPLPERLQLATNGTIYNGTRCTDRKTRAALD